MPKGQPPRISDKSLIKKNNKKYPDRTPTKVAPAWELDKSRVKIRGKTYENKNTLKSDMDPNKYTLRKKPNIKYVEKRK